MKYRRKRGRDIKKAWKSVAWRLETLAHIRIIENEEMLCVYLDDGLLSLDTRNDGQLLDVDDEIS